MYGINYGGGCGLLIGLIVISLLFMIVAAAIPYILIGAAIMGLLIFFDSRRLN